MDGGSPEVTRLRVQAEALEASAESLLDAVGVTSGSSALDLACGPFGLLGPLARRVGPTGRVVGLDFDPAEVSAAREHVRALNLHNVDVVQGDAFHTEFAPDSFDIVHARFLLAPVGHAPELLREMVRVVKPGGFVVLEEPESNGWTCFPNSAGFERLKGVIRDCFRMGGGDFDSGRKLYALQLEAGLSDIRTRGVALTLQNRHPYMRSSVQFATSLRRRILENGLLTASELDEATADVEHAISRPETLMISFLVVQSWGRKPTSG